MFPTVNLTGYTITSLIDIVRLLLPLQASILLTAFISFIAAEDWELSIFLKSDNEKSPIEGNQSG